MDITQKTVISLMKSALYKEKTVIPEGFDIREFKSIVYRHNIWGLMYFGLNNSGIKLPEWLLMNYQIHSALLEMLWYKYDEIAQRFAEEGIENIPLKGIYIKDLYPSKYMRQMGDIDILIHEGEYREKIRPIMLSMGYTEGTESDHELHWYKDNQLIEFHKRIIPSYNKDFYKVIGDGWDWVQENQYAYIFTHFAKHYRDKGIGISHLVDLEILRGQATDSKLKELHLDKFYENVQRTLDCWFRDKEYDEITERITDTIFSSGEFGTKETSAKSQNLKKINEVGGNAKKARFKDFFNKIFPPYKVMKIRYTYLEKLPILLPFMWVWRIIVAPFRGNVKKVYKDNKAITRDNYYNYKEELNSVGLDYWF